ncbi:hypothetical protein V2J09_022779 [Rumex salicifolius]
MAVSPEKIVADIGKQLAAQTRPSKDFIVKSLRQAESALSKLEQLSSLKPSITPLSKSLVKNGLLRHKDKDIRLLVAICFCEIMRILAPDPSFSDKTFKDVFELFISTFAELGDTSSPYFSRRAKILETVAGLECCQQMLDLGCDDLVLKMFSTFFSVVREEHSQSLVNWMWSIMALICNQEEISQPLLEVFLQNFRIKGEGLQPASYQLAAKLIHDCAERIKPAVCGFLTSCILERDSMQSDLRGSYQDIIYGIYCTAPDILVAIIPHIIEELLTDQVDVRIKSLNLVGKLLAHPKSRNEQEDHHLFVALLQRFSDKVAEVRLSALRCVRACYVANPVRVESHEILCRLLDFDSSVRAEAVVALCDLAVFSLKFFPAELIVRATERLRDKMASVRKVAMKKLLEVYHHYCIKCSEGQIELNQYFEQIPCSILMLCYDRSSKDVRPQTLELVLAEDLFPNSLQVEERTRHWIFLYSLFSPAHVKALNFVLSLKRRLQTEIQVYLSLRKKKDNHSEEVTQRMRTAVTRMSAVFPDPAKTEECFSLLNQIKDNGIFDSLARLLNETEYGKAMAIRDALLRKIGDKNPCTDFLKSLCSKCIYNIFNSEHVHYILQYILSYRGRDNPLQESSINLLVVILNNFPLLLRGTDDQVKLLLLENETPFSEMFIKIVAKAGPFISMRLSDIYPSLERFCLDGTCGQAKAAISAIIALVGTSEKYFLVDICQNLVKSLYTGRNVLSALQSLGCLAQHNAIAFQKQEKEISSYIKDQIFKAKLSSGCSSLYEKSGCHVSLHCKLKIYGLKLLVKSFRSKKVADGRPQIASLLEILLRLLKKGEFTDASMIEVDMAHLRLAAAKSVLRLSGKWDLHISPQIFQATVMTAKDDSPFVRRLFLDKTHRLLKEHAIPIKYACSFPLAASDCEKDLQNASSSYLVDFITDYTWKAHSPQIGQDYATEAASMTDCPAYIVVFLLYLLAHDETFPPGDCKDEAVYAQFYIPLYALLHSLVNAQSIKDLDIVKSSFSCLLSIFRAIKKADDATDHQQTLKLHKLADVGSFILQTIKHKGIDSSLVPSRDSTQPPGSAFDEIMLKKLTNAIQHQFNQPAITTTHVKKIHKDPFLEKFTKQNSGFLGACKQVSSLVKGNGELKDRQETDKAVASDANIRGRQKDCSGSGCTEPVSTSDQPLGISSITLALSQTGSDMSVQVGDTCSAFTKDSRECNRSDLKGLADRSSVDHLHESDIARKCSSSGGGGILISQGKALSDRTNSLATNGLKEQSKKRKGHLKGYLTSVASRTRRKKG